MDKRAIALSQFVPQYHKQKRKTDPSCLRGEEKEEGATPSSRVDLNAVEDQPFGHRKGRIVVTV